MASNVEIEMTCKCGVLYTVSPEVIAFRNLGIIFIERFKEFREQLDCGCRDAAALMNRWGPSNSRERVDRLVQLVFTKTQHVSRDQIKQAILESIDQYEEQQRGIIA